MTGEELRGLVAGLRSRTSNAELLAVLDEAVRLEREVRRLEVELVCAQPLLFSRREIEAENERLRGLVDRMAGEVRSMRSRGRGGDQTIAAAERARRHEERKAKGGRDAGLV